MTRGWRVSSDLSERRVPVSAWRPLAGLIRSLSAPLRVTVTVLPPRFPPRPTPVVSATHGLEVGDRMLADQLDYIVGVDPHSRSARARGGRGRYRRAVFEATVAANSDGYATRSSLAEQHAPVGARSRSRVLAPSARTDSLPRRRRRAGARGRPAAQGAAHGGKTDALDASAPPAACSQASDRRRPVLAAIARRCRRWLPHARAPSTRSAPDSVSYATC